MLATASLTHPGREPTVAMVGAYVKRQTARKCFWIVRACGSELHDYVERSIEIPLKMYVSSSNRPELTEVGHEDADPMQDSIPNFDEIVQPFTVKISCVIPFAES